MDTFYKELLKLREDAEQKSGDLADWKTKIGTDLVQFYRKYDGQMRDGSMMGKSHLDIINTTLNEMTDNIAKNR